MIATSLAARLKRIEFPRSARVLLLGLLIAGCSPPKPDKVTIRGSNTFGEELAPRLIAEYKKDHPGTAFDLEFKGSSYGIGGIMSGWADIGASSRELAKFEPALAKERGLELVDHVIGSYAVAVVIHSGNPVRSLTRDQIRDIFTGVVQNWREVGGRDAAIHLYIRDPISGTHLGFQELAVDRKPYATSVKPLTTYAAIVAAVVKDPDAIGYTSLDLLVKPGVKGISVGDIAPSAANVKAGKYPFARILHLFTVKPTEPAAARDFVEFVTSPRGQKIVEEMGFVAKP